jgi:uncharacterized protein
VARSWVGRHRLVAFFVVAYTVTWVGLPFWAFGVLPEPLFLPCGPLVAALLVIGLTEGRPGFRALGARMTRWRVGWSWWVVALGLPPGMVLLAALLNGAAGAAAPALPSWGGMALLFGLFLVNPLGGALGEEPGWRGYAQPCLQARWSPLVSALALGALVAGWHLPLVATGQLGTVGVITTVAITVVYAWLFNRTGGSALITLIAHALQDSFTFGALSYAAADAARIEYLYSLVVIAVAVAVVVLDRTAWKAAAAVRPGRSGASHSRRQGRAAPRGPRSPRPRRR